MITRIRNIQQNCTNQYGLFDRNKFMFLAGVFFCFNIEKIKSDDDLKDINRCVYKILGNGHSLISCIQFLRGKEAERTIRDNVPVPVAGNPRSHRQLSWSLN